MFLYLIDEKDSFEYLMSYQKNILHLTILLKVFNFVLYENEKLEKNHQYE